MAGTVHAERLRSMYDAFARRDLDAFLEFCSPELVIRSDIGSYPPGPAGVRAWWHDLTDAFAVGAPHVDLLIDLGDVVCSLMSGVWRGYASGVEFDAQRLHVTRWREGLVLWWGFFRSVEEALDAAPLDEEQRAGWEAVAAVREAFEAGHGDVEPLEMRWLGGLCLTFARPRAGAGSTRTDQGPVYLSAVRDGVVIRHEAFAGEAEALAAAGVSP